MPGYGGGIIVTAVTTARLPSRTIFVRMRSRADFTIVPSAIVRVAVQHVQYCGSAVQSSLVQKFALQRER